ncbi:nitrate reductase [Shewanella acanthi]|uniref:nitrate reductase n=1 Tax=Shewanella acanthi TaxID=2864212 RepID=UPI001C65A54A|nr:molybdopterin-dependent oxidoreductase [Shewanella acanthi]QYJ78730.1 molybdopterin-dependent oxidoreductase [Shewanella acanthi]
MKLTQTNCAYCGVGCGIEVMQSDQQFALKGDAEHPANHGRLCQKGERLLDTLPLPQALRYPRLGANGKQLTWDQATSLVASKFSEAIAEHGSDSVAFYLSGQLLTEDYYVANKLAKGFWGTANVDTNSRLCMSSAVSAHLRAFGEDVVPGCYQDFDLADVIVLVGANTAWTHPVLFQRILRARESRGTKLVVIDPRRTATARQADLHIAIKPGQDLWLFSLLFKHLSQTNAVDHGYIANHTSGSEDALTQLANWLGTDENALQQSGVSATQFQQLLALYCDNEAVVTASCMGVNQSVTGTDTTNAIINCHLLKGHIGQPGCGFFSLTGQPNAMGGREVGGLATQLANHMGFSCEERQLLADFWPRSNIAPHAGLTATELFQAMADGKINAVWIMATNPLASLPDSALVRRALQTCPFVVVSDITSDTDTAQFADVLLPAQGWSEKSGTTTNSERRISRQRAFKPALGEARADWQMVCDVAKAIGYQGFDYASAADIFREYAALSAKVKQAFPHKLFDLSALQHITDDAYEALSPIQWPVTSSHAHNRLYSDGVFSFADGRARFVVPSAAPMQPEATHTDTLILLSGRSRDQWHTRSRTGHVAQLVAHEQQPCVYAHPDTLVVRELVSGQLVTLQGQQTAEANNELLVQVIADDTVPVDQLFMSMHWTGRETAVASVNLLLDSRIDTISKQPAFKGQRVAISSRKDLLQGIEWGNPTAIENTLYRFEQVLAKGACHHFALPACDSPEARNGLKWTVENVEIHCELKAGRIHAIRLLSPLRIAIDKTAVFALIDDIASAQSIGKLEQLVRAGDSPLVCVCKGVSRDQIITVAQSFAPAKRFEAVQQLTGCGTGCGSCRGELLSILEQGLTPSHSAVTMGGVQDAD